MTEYESEKYGYLPHDRQTRVSCPNCGGTLFGAYPQTISLTAPVWCSEYTCKKCGWVLGVEVDHKTRTMEDEE